MYTLIFTDPMLFLSTLSLRRATAFPGFLISCINNFYPRSPCGERPKHSANPKNRKRNFYPRSPCGERQRAENHANSQQEFLSTLSLRRATSPVWGLAYTSQQFLSTLSLRRATTSITLKRYRPTNFYPRSPCGERHTPIKAYNIIRGFLSTLSLRRATYQGQAGFAGYLHFYPRSPCGERLMLVQSFGDNRHFYPRSPCGERLLPSWELYQMLRISIHALLAESDLRTFMRRSTATEFLSTLSLRRATSDKLSLSGTQTFLSTLSLRRATVVMEATKVENQYFYPRSPCGERHLRGTTATSREIFLSTLSLRRATISTILCLLPTKFLSTLSLRRATLNSS